MTEQTHALRVAQVNEHCKTLRLPTLAGSFERLEKEAGNQLSNICWEKLILFEAEFFGFDSLFNLSCF